MSWVGWAAEFAVSGFKRCGVCANFAGVVVASHYARRAVPDFGSAAGTSVHSVVEA